MSLFFVAVSWPFSRAFTTSGAQVVQPLQESTCVFTWPEGLLFSQHTAKNLEELLVRQASKPGEEGAQEGDRARVPQNKLGRRFLPKLSETDPVKVGREPDSTGGAGNTTLHCSTTIDRCNLELQSIKVCLTRLFLYEDWTSSAGSVYFVYPCVFIVGVWFSQ